MTGRLIDPDAHGHALHHLDPVAGCILRWQNRELRAGSRSDRRHHRWPLDVRIRIHHNLRLLAERGILQAGPESNKILNVIGSVRWFLYSRMDSLGGATNIVNWKTNADNKMMIFSQLRDSLDKPDALEVRSLKLVQEMQAIVEDDGWIGAGPDTGVNDDLVMGTVLAHHAWIKYYRDALSNRGYTWKSVHEKPPKDPQAIMSHIVSTHFQAMNRKASQRKDVF